MFTIFKSVVQLFEAQLQPEVFQHNKTCSSFSASCVADYKITQMQKTDRFEEINHPSNSSAVLTEDKFCFIATDLRVSSLCLVRQLLLTVRLHFISTNMKVTDQHLPPFIILLLCDLFFLLQNNFIPELNSH